MKDARRFHLDAGTGESLQERGAVGTLTRSCESANLGQECIPTLGRVGGSNKNAAAQQLFGLTFVIAAAVHVEDLHMKETHERDDLGGSGFLPMFSAPYPDDVVSNDGSGLV